MRGMVGSTIRLALMDRITWRLLSRILKSIRSQSSRDSMILSMMLIDFMKPPKNGSFRAVPFT
jgi:hypothetical protein